MKLSDLDYALPKELIAQFPLGKRDASRLLISRCDKKNLEDARFADLVNLIPSGDLLVLNDTKVFPARILGRKKKTEGRVDMLLLEEAPLSHQKEGVSVWRCLIQPSLKEDQEILISSTDKEAIFLGRDRDGIPLVGFKNVEDVRELARVVGTMPLPPYIKREVRPEDQEAYQTIYAKKYGAVAAPTAGLHFTKELLQQIEKKGVKILYVTLHVGYGTFKPVEDLENHRMHEEYFELQEETAEAINQAKKDGRKIWAVGTTTLRVLETCVQKKKLIPGKGSTDLYIREPFEFEAVDRLITNFHLPKTTLLLLVSAFMSEDFRIKAYAHAVAEKYRFFSYGDAMVILR